MASGAQPEAPMRLAVVLDQCMLRGTNISQEDVRAAIANAVYAQLLLRANPSLQHELYLCCLDSQASPTSGPMQHGPPSLPPTTTLQPLHSASAVTEGAELDQTRQGLLAAGLQGSDGAPHAGLTQAAPFSVERCTLDTVKGKLKAWFPGKKEVDSSMSGPSTNLPRALAATSQCLQHLQQAFGGADVGLSGGTCVILVTQLLRLENDAEAWRQAQGPAVTHAESDQEAYAQALGAAQSGMATQVAACQADLHVLDCGWYLTTQDRDQLMDNLRSAVAQEASKQVAHPSSSASASAPSTQPCNMCCVAVSELAVAKSIEAPVTLIGCSLDQAQVAWSSWEQAHPSLKNRSVRYILHKGLAPPASLLPAPPSALTAPGPPSPGRLQGEAGGMDWDGPVGETVSVSGNNGKENSAPSGRQSVGGSGKSKIPLGGGGHPSGVRKHTSTSAARGVSGSGGGGSGGSGHSKLPAAPHAGVLRPGLKAPAGATARLKLLQQPGKDAPNAPSSSAAPGASGKPAAPNRRAGLPPKASQAPAPSGAAGAARDPSGAHSGAVSAGGLDLQGATSAAAAAAASALGDRSLSAWKLLQGFDAALIEQDRAAKKSLKALQADDHSRKDVAGLKQLFEPHRIYGLARGPVRDLVSSLLCCTVGSLEDASRRTTKEQEAAQAKKARCEDVTAGGEECGESEGPAVQAPTRPKESDQGVTSAKDMRRPSPQEVLLLLRSRYFNSSSDIYQRTKKNKPLRLFRLMRRAYEACHTIAALGVLSDPSIKRDARKMRARMEQCINMVKAVVSEYYPCRNVVLGPLRDHPAGYACDVPGDNFEADIKPCFESELPELMRHVSLRYQGTEKEALPDPQQEAQRKEGYLAFNEEERLAAHDPPVLGGGPTRTSSAADGGGGGEGSQRAASSGGTVRLGEAHSRPLGMPRAAAILHHRSDIIGGNAHGRPQVVKRHAPAPTAAPTVPPPAASTLDASRGGSTAPAGRGAAGSSAAAGSQASKQQQQGAQRGAQPVQHGAKHVQQPAGQRLVAQRAGGAAAGAGARGATGPAVAVAASMQSPAHPMPFGREHMTLLGATPCEEDDLGLDSGTAAGGYPMHDSPPDVQPQALALRLDFDMLSPARPAREPTLGRGQGGSKDQAGGPSGEGGGGDGGGPSARVLELLGGATGDAGAVVGQPPPGGAAAVGQLSKNVLAGALAQLAQAPAQPGVPTVTDATDPLVRPAVDQLPSPGRAVDLLPDAQPTPDDVPLAQRGKAGRVGRGGRGARGGRSGRTARGGKAARGRRASISAVQEDALQDAPADDEKEQEEEVVPAAAQAAAVLEEEKEEEEVVQAAAEGAAVQQQQQEEGVVPAAAAEAAGVQQEEEEEATAGVEAAAEGLPGVGQAGVADGTPPGAEAGVGTPRRKHVSPREACPVDSDASQVQGTDDENSDGHMEHMEGVEVVEEVPGGEERRIRVLQPQAYMKGKEALAHPIPDAWSPGKPSSTRHATRAQFAPSLGTAAAAQRSRAAEQMRGCCGSAAAVAAGNSGAAWPGAQAGVPTAVARATPGLGSRFMRRQAIKAAQSPGGVRQGGLSPGPALQPLQAVGQMAAGDCLEQVAAATLSAPTAAVSSPTAQDAAAAPATEPAAAANSPTAQGAAVTPASEPAAAAASSLVQVAAAAPALKPTANGPEQLAAAAADQHAAATTAPVQAVALAALASEPAAAATSTVQVAAAAACEPPAAAGPLLLDAAAAVPVIEPIVAASTPPVDVAAAMPATEPTAAASSPARAAATSSVEPTTAVGLPPQPDQCATPSLPTGGAGISAAAQAALQLLLSMPAQGDPVTVQRVLSLPVDGAAALEPVQALLPQPDQALPPYPPIDEVACSTGWQPEQAVQHDLPVWPGPGPGPVQLSLLPLDQAMWPEQEPLPQLDHPHAPTLNLSATPFAHHALQPPTAQVTIESLNRELNMMSQVPHGAGMLPLAPIQLPGAAGAHGACGQGMPGADPMGMVQGWQSSTGSQALGIHLATQYQPLQLHASMAGESSIGGVATCQPAAPQPSDAATAVFQPVQQQPVQQQQPSALAAPLLLPESPACHLDPAQNSLVQQLLRAAEENRAQLEWQQLQLAQGTAAPGGQQLQPMQVTVEPGREQPQALPPVAADAAHPADETVEAAHQPAAIATRPSQQAPAAAEAAQHAEQPAAAVASGPTPPTELPAAVAEAALHDEQLAAPAETGQPLQQPAAAAETAQPETGKPLQQLAASTAEAARPAGQLAAVAAEAPEPAMQPFATVMAPQPAEQPATAAEAPQPAELPVTAAEAPQHAEQPATAADMAQPAERPVDAVAEPQPTVQPAAGVAAPVAVLLPQPSAAPPGAATNTCAAAPVATAVSAAPPSSVEPTPDAPAGQLPVAATAGPVAAEAGTETMANAPAAPVNPINTQPSSARPSSRKGKVSKAAAAVVVVSLAASTDASHGPPAGADTSFPVCKAKSQKRLDDLKSAAAAQGLPVDVEGVAWTVTFKARKNDPSNLDYTFHVSCGSKQLQGRSPKELLSLVEAEHFFEDVAPQPLPSPAAGQEAAPQPAPDTGLPAADAADAAVGPAVDQVSPVRGVVGQLPDPQPTPDDVPLAQRGKGGRKGRGGRAAAAEAAAAAATLLADAADPAVAPAAAAAPAGVAAAPSDMAVAAAPAAGAAVAAPTPTARAAPAGADVPAAQQVPGTPSRPAAPADTGPSAGRPAPRTSGRKRVATGKGGDAGRAVSTEDDTGAAAAAAVQAPDAITSAAVPADAVAAQLPGAPANATPVDGGVAQLPGTSATAAPADDDAAATPADAAPTAGGDQHELTDEQEEERARALDGRPVLYNGKEGVVRFLGADHWPKYLEVQFTNGTKRPGLTYRSLVRWGKLQQVEEGAMQPAAGAQPPAVAATVAPGTHTAECERAAGPATAPAGPTTRRVAASTPAGPATMLEAPAPLAGTTPAADPAASRPSGRKRRASVGEAGEPGPATATGAATVRTFARKRKASAAGGSNNTAEAAEAAAAAVGAAAAASIGADTTAAAAPETTAAAGASAVAAPADADSDGHDDDDDAALPDRSDPQAKAQQKLADLKSAAVARGLPVDVDGVEWKVSYQPCTSSVGKRGVRPVFHFAYGSIQCKNRVIDVLLDRVQKRLLKDGVQLPPNAPARAAVAEPTTLAAAATAALVAAAATSLLAVAPVQAQALTPSELAAAPAEPAAASAELAAASAELAVAPAEPAAASAELAAASAELAVAPAEPAAASAELAAASAELAVAPAEPAAASAELAAASAELAVAPAEPAAASAELAAASAELAVAPAELPVVASTLLPAATAAGPPAATIGPSATQPAPPGAPSHSAAAQPAAAKKPRMTPKQKDEAAMALDGQPIVWRGTPGVVKFITAAQRPKYFNIQMVDGSTSPAIHYNKVVAALEKRAAEAEEQEVTAGAGEGQRARQLHLPTVAEDVEAEGAEAEVAEPSPGEAAAAAGVAEAAAAGPAAAPAAGAVQVAEPVAVAPATIKAVRSRRGAAAQADAPAATPTPTTLPSTADTLASAPSPDPTTSAATSAMPSTGRTGSQPTGPKRQAAGVSGSAGKATAKQAVAAAQPAGADSVVKAAVSAGPTGVAAAVVSEVPPAVTPSSAGGCLDLSQRPDLHPRAQESLAELKSAAVARGLPVDVDGVSWTVTFQTRVKGANAKQVDRYFNFAHGPIQQRYNTIVGLLNIVERKLQELGVVLPAPGQPGTTATAVPRSAAPAPARADPPGAGAKRKGGQDAPAEPAEPPQKRARRSQSVLSPSAPARSVALPAPAPFASPTTRARSTATPAPAPFASPTTRARATATPAPAPLTSPTTRARSAALPAPVPITSPTTRARSTATPAPAPSATPPTRARPATSPATLPPATKATPGSAGPGSRKGPSSVVQPDLVRLVMNMSHRTTPDRGMPPGTSGTGTGRTSATPDRGVAGSSGAGTGRTSATPDRGVPGTSGAGAGRASATPTTATKAAGRADADGQAGMPVGGGAARGTQLLAAGAAAQRGPFTSPTTVAEVTAGSRATRASAGPATRAAGPAGGTNGTPSGKRASVTPARVPKPPSVAAGTALAATPSVAPSAQTGTVGATGIPAPAASPSVPTTQPLCGATPGQPAATSPASPLSVSAIALPATQPLPANTIGGSACLPSTQASATLPLPATQPLSGATPGQQSGTLPATQPLPGASSSAAPTSPPRAPPSSLSLPSTQLLPGTTLPTTQPLQHAVLAPATAASGTPQGPGILHPQAGPQAAQGGTPQGPASRPTKGRSTVQGGAAQGSGAGSITDLLIEMQAPSETLAAHCPLPALPAAPTAALLADMPAHITPAPAGAVEMPAVAAPADATTAQGNTGPSLPAPSSTTTPQAVVVAGEEGAHTTLADPAAPASAPTTGTFLGALADHGWGRSGGLLRRRSGTATPARPAANTTPTGNSASVTPVALAEVPPPQATVTVAPTPAPVPQVAPLAPLLARTATLMGVPALGPLVTTAPLMGGGGPALGPLPVTPAHTPAPASLPVEPAAVPTLPCAPSAAPSVTGQPQLVREEISQPQPPAVQPLLAVQLVPVPAQPSQQQEQGLQLPQAQVSPQPSQQHEQGLQLAQAQVGPQPPQLQGQGFQLPQAQVVGSQGEVMQAGQQEEDEEVLLLQRLAALRQERLERQRLQQQAMQQGGLQQAAQAGGPQGGLQQQQQPVSSAQLQQQQELAATTSVQQQPSAAAGQQQQQSTTSGQHQLQQQQQPSTSTATVDQGWVRQRLVQGILDTPATQDAPLDSQEDAPLDTQEQEEEEGEEQVAGCPSVARMHPRRVLILSSQPSQGSPTHHNHQPLQLPSQTSVANHQPPTAHPGPAVTRNLQARWASSSLETVLEIAPTQETGQETAQDLLVSGSQGLSPSQQPADATQQPAGGRGLLLRPLQQQQAAEATRQPAAVLQADEASGTPAPVCSELPGQQAGAQGPVAATPQPPVPCAQGPASATPQPPVPCAASDEQQPPMPGHAGGSGAGNVPAAENSSGRAAGGSGNRVRLPFGSALTRRIEAAQRKSGLPATGVLGAGLAATGAGGEASPAVDSGHNDAGAGPLYVQPGGLLPPQPSPQTDNLAVGSHVDVPGSGQVLGGGAAAQHEGPAGGGAGSEQKTGLRFRLKVKGTPSQPPETPVHATITLNNVGGAGQGGKGPGVPGDGAAAGGQGRGVGSATTPARGRRVQQGLPGHGGVEEEEGDTPMATPGGRTGMDDEGGTGTEGLRSGKRQRRAPAWLNSADWDGGSPEVGAGVPGERLGKPGPTPGGQRGVRRPREMGGAAGDDQAPSTGGKKRARPAA